MLSFQETWQYSKKQESFTTVSKWSCLFLPINNFSPRYVMYLMYYIYSIISSCNMNIRFEIRSWEPVGSVEFHSRNSLAGMGDRFLKYAKLFKWNVSVRWICRVVFTRVSFRLVITTRLNYLHYLSTIMSVTLPTHTWRIHFCSDVTVCRREFRELLVRLIKLDGIAGFVMSFWMFYCRSWTARTNMS